MSSVQSCFSDAVLGLSGLVLDLVLEEGTLRVMLFLERPRLVFEQSRPNFENKIRLYGIQYILLLIQKEFLNYTPDGDFLQTESIN